MEVHLIVKIIFSVAFLGAVSLLLHLYKTFWLNTEKLRRKLSMQGIKGPRPTLFYGNLHEMQKIQMMVATKSSNNSNFIAHDYTATLFPYLEQWRKEYGKLHMKMRPRIYLPVSCAAQLSEQSGQIYTYSTGMKQHLYVNQPDLVKEINQCLTLDLGKPTYLTKRLAPMLGNGIMRSNGLAWSQQRKVIAPEFYMEKVKTMVGLMVSSTIQLLSKWENYIEAQSSASADIKVDQDLRGVSADVIARACFGSSYDKGKEIFTKLRILQESLSQQSVLFGINNFGLFPMRKHRMLSSLEKEIETLIWETVEERQRLCSEASSYEKDLLHLILEGATNYDSMDRLSSKCFIVDNCKNMYFAGHDTVAVTASWCLMLLALHPEWQAHIREEVTEVFGDSLPTAESLSQLKIVTMVIQEGLRLYPPGAFVSREALEDLKIGNLVIPKGVCMWTLIPTVHRDTDIWGPDANEFKPERFSNGVSGACKIPQAYIPFGVGSRLCLGKNFAMVELKVILSLIVSRFCFTLSPKYRHYPRYNMIVVPGHGVHIIIQRISLGKPAQD